MSAEIEITGIDSEAKEFAMQNQRYPLKIETPVLGHQIASLQMNGVEYPLAGLLRIVFEVSAGKVNTLTLEYIPREAIEDE